MFIGSWSVLLMLASTRNPEPVGERNGKPVYSYVASAHVAGRDEPVAVHYRQTGPPIPYGTLVMVSGMFSETSNDVFIGAKRIKTIKYFGPGVDIQDHRNRPRLVFDAFVSGPVVFEGTASRECLAFDTVVYGPVITTIRCIFEPAAAVLERLPILYERHKISIIGDVCEYDGEHVAVKVVSFSCFVYPPYMTEAKVIFRGKGVDEITEIVECSISFPANLPPSSSRASIVSGGTSTTEAGSVLAEEPDAAAVSPALATPSLPSSTPQVGQPPTPAAFARSSATVQIIASPTPNRALRSPTPARAVRSPTPARPTRSPSPPRVARSPTPARATYCTSPTPLSSARASRTKNHTPSTPVARPRPASLVQVASNALFATPAAAHVPPTPDTPVASRSQAEPWTIPQQHAGNEGAAPLSNPSKWLNGISPYVANESGTQASGSDLPIPGRGRIDRLPESSPAPNTRAAPLPPAATAFAALCNPEQINAPDTGLPSSHTEIDPSKSDNALNTKAFHASTPSLLALSVAPGHGAADDGGAAPQGPSATFFSMTTLGDPVAGAGVQPSENAADAHATDDSNGAGNALDDLFAMLDAGGWNETIDPRFLEALRSSSSEPLSAASPHLTTVAESSRLASSAHTAPQLDPACVADSAKLRHAPQMSPVESVQPIDDFATPRGEGHDATAPMETSPGEHQSRAVDPLVVSPPQTLRGEGHDASTPMETSPGERQSRTVDPLPTQRSHDACTLMETSPGEAKSGSMTDSLGVPLPDKDAVIVPKRTATAGNTAGRSTAISNGRETGPPVPAPSMASEPLPFDQMFWQLDSEASAFDQLGIKDLDVSELFQTSHAFV